MIIDELKSEYTKAEQYRLHCSMPEKAIIVVIGSAISLCLTVALILSLPNGNVSNHAVGSPSPTTSAESESLPNWTGREKDAVSSVRRYRNPRSERQTPRRIGAFLDGVAGAFVSSRLPSNTEWTASHETHSIYHVEARISAPALSGPGTTVYSFHVDLQTDNVSAAPDVRPTPIEQRGSTNIIYEDARYLMEKLLLDEN